MEMLSCGMRTELLLKGSKTGEELELCESKVVKEWWQAIGRTEPERRELLKFGINCLWHLSQRRGEQVL